MPKFETVMSDPIEITNKGQPVGTGGVDVAKVKSEVSQAGGRSYEEGFGKRKPVTLTNPGEPIDAGSLASSVDELRLKIRNRGTLDERVEAVSQRRTELVQKSELGQPEKVKPTVGKGGEITPERLARLQQELDQAQRDLKAAEKKRQEAIALYNLKTTPQNERDELEVTARDLFERKIPDLELLCEELKTEIAVVASELKRKGM